MKTTEYEIRRIKQGRKVIAYVVTDGIWASKEYTNLKEAREALNKALWGEGVNTL